MRRMPIQISTHSLREGAAGDRLIGGHRCVSGLHNRCRRSRQRRSRYRDGPEEVLALRESGIGQICMREVEAGLRKASISETRR